MDAFFNKCHFTFKALDSLKQHLFKLKMYFVFDCDKKMATKEKYKNLLTFLCKNRTTSLANILKKCYLISFIHNKLMKYL